jgi:nucleotide-binding universal stress UspA family protein
MEHKSTDATVRHELGLGDLSGIESEVTLEQYGPTTRRAIESILVPVAGGPHSDVAVRLAANIAESWNASVQLLTVVPPSADQGERADAEARLRTYAETVEAVPVDTRLETRDDVVAAIADLTRSHELVVIGASEGSLFRRFFRGTVPERLGSESRVPIFVVKAR